MQNLLKYVGFRRLRNRHKKALGIFAIFLAFFIVREWVYGKSELPVVERQSWSHTDNDHVVALKSQIGTKLSFGLSSVLLMFYF